MWVNIPLALTWLIHARQKANSGMWHKGTQRHSWGLAAGRRRKNIPAEGAALNSVNRAQSHARTPLSPADPALSLAKLTISRFSGADLASCYPGEEMSLTRSPSRCSSGFGAGLAKQQALTLGWWLRPTAGSTFFFFFFFCNRRQVGLYLVETSLFGQWEPPHLFRGKPRLWITGKKN